MVGFHFCGDRCYAMGPGDTEVKVCNMAKPENVTCPLCDGPMKPRTSSYGKFWGCADYPRCTGTRNGEGEASVARDSSEAELPSQRWRNRDRSRWND
jgi:ssDNA-binding Zn-finger/Zn-ribbon topoisomerase 1